MGTITTRLLNQAGLPTHRPPTSPGEMVRAFLEDLDCTQADAARALDISTNRLNEVVKDRRRISADTALRLAAYLGTSPQFWLNVQAAWDVWHEVRRGAAAYHAIVGHRPKAVRATSRSRAHAGGVE